MSQRVIVVLLFVLAAILRLHNAWMAPPLSGFDGPYHAAYIGILHFEGRLPLADEGWSTFHPPFYYALSAGLWSLLPQNLAPEWTLFWLRLLNVACGLALGWIAYACARRLFPLWPSIPVQAAAIALFIPMLVGPSSQLGNEMLSATLCALALWVLLGWLKSPASRTRAMALGVVLGTALLTKFTAFAVFAGAVALMVWRSGLRYAAMVAIAALVVSGWYYVRNIQHYGRPVVMQTQKVTEVMRGQGYGSERDLGDYVSLRSDAVWPATFRSIWFDRFGTLIDVHSAWGARFAAVLFVLGGACSLLFVLGSWAVFTHRIEIAIPGGFAALVVILGLVGLAYWGFTYRVATDSALKGSYASAALLSFVLLAGAGGAWLSQRGGTWDWAVRVTIASLVLATTIALWSGGLAPMRANPAEFYLGVYSDPPTLRVSEYFLGRR